MKIISKSILIFSILIMLSIPAKATRVFTYYGLIDTSPVTMTLEFNDDGTMTGKYFYNEFKKDIELIGDYQDEEMTLYVENERGEEIERFYGLWDDINEEKGNYPARIIGNWLHENKSYNFDIRSEPFTGKEINPLDDKRISIKEMKVFPDLIFGDLDVDLGSGCCSPVEVEYYNDIPLGRLYQLGEDIRSQVRENSGTLMYAQWRFYQFFLTKATFAPKILMRHASWLLDVKEDTLNYFKRWSLKSIYNFNMYNEFIVEFAKSRQEIYKYYRKDHKLNYEEASLITDIILARVLERAAGSYPGVSTGYFQLDVFSPLLAAIYGGENESKIKELLKEEKDEEKKAEALRAVILLDRPLFLVKMLTQNIEDISSEEESPLSCAVNNYKKTKLLINLGLDVNHENPFGKTPLFYAIQYGDIDVVKLLVENGADVNHKYKSVDDIDEWEYMLIEHGRRTPLMHAAQHADVDVLKYLLKTGAYLKAVDEFGDNVLDYAIRGDKRNNIEFLKSKGLKENNESLTGVIGEGYADSTGVVKEQEVFRKYPSFTIEQDGKEVKTDDYYKGNESLFKRIAEENPDKLYILEDKSNNEYMFYEGSSLNRGLYHLWYSLVDQENGEIDSLCGGYSDAASGGLGRGI